MNNEIEERLKELNIEDFIWIIYIGIIFMSYYANGLERKYFTKNDIQSKKKYREIMIGIFIVLVIVYIYFLIDSYQSLKSININTSKKQKDLLILSFLGSLFIVISGIIFLYIAIKDEDLNVELAFN
jgi:hypothetical protein